MADLDAALDVENAFAIRRRITGDDVANIGDMRRFWQVAAPVDARVVEIFYVGTGNEIAHVGNGAINDELHRFLEADRAEIAGLTAKMLDDLSFGCEPVTLVQAGNFAGLDFVEFMVAAQQ